MTDRIVIEELAPMHARVRYVVAQSDLRPGGTVSGPAMFTLADCAFYVATLAMIGREALTVTTSATINFMRKPAPGDLIGEARILKLGRSLSVGDVMLQVLAGTTQCSADGGVINGRSRTRLNAARAGALLAENFWNMREVVAWNISSSSRLCPSWRWNLQSESMKWTPAGLSFSVM